MATQPRPSHTSSDQSPLDLLQTLLDAPPAPSGARLGPVALRSVAEQRRFALRRYTLRTGVDRALFYAERLLLLATVAFFGYWVLDGPVRDWIHDVRQPARGARATDPAGQLAGAAEAASITTPGAHSNRAVLLPSIRPGGASAPAALAHDFIAPRGRPPAASGAALQQPQIAPGDVAPQPTHLLIPALALDTPVVETFVVDEEWQVAEYAAGYLHGTAFPGDGNTALAGHAGLRGAVFRDLGALKWGDDIYVDAGGWRYRYRVRESKSVWPDQTEVLDLSPTPILTLMTCTNWDTQRLVVVADLVESKPFTGG
jgi:sortase A